MAPSLPSFFFFLLLRTLTMAYAATSPDDIEALRSFVAAVEPASVPAGSCLSTWDLARDPCDSAFGPFFTCGLLCSDPSPAAPLRRVTAVALAGAAYSGDAARGASTLSDNRFSGPLPASPAALPPRLLRLSLSRNSLSGPIPSSLFPLSPPSPLRELYLDGNLLSGPIPGELSSLRALAHLDLRSNNLSGPIPDLGPVRGLLYLQASDNALSGPFPGPGRLPASLLAASLRGNRLGGALRGASLAALPALRVLDLAGNALEGGVPGAAFAHPALEQLNLASNRLGGRVEEPADGAWSTSRLVAVELGRNRIGGALPGFFGMMPRLAAVGLEGNRFVGVIPPQYALRVAGLGLGEWAPFARLMLAGNYLIGPIPSPMEGLKEGSAVVTLADNCLLRCPPQVYFFCQGLPQKPAATCRAFNPGQSSPHLS
ncbi:probable LRR receptor-like serine/threonine-protein kinase At4g20940 [Ananas comosus]|uniref:Probable LRR receptor-like serine/threonine-protein kinase At4g20940 n=1 Tax=Ananas comosus TaxID=4615 RepID=A0A6P5EUW4_ANACO|nr:probable LRR receptor-like serine/threonine-protein kinase At4g20940 [Ananas comosus]